METLLRGALASADVVIELAGLPPMVVSLATEPGDAPPNALLAALRPAVTLRLSGVQIVRSAPYGEPRTGAPWGVVLVGGAALGLVVLIWAIAR